MLAPLLAVGGHDGEPFYHVYPDQDVVLRHLKVWSGGWQLRGIEAQFSNGDRYLIGAAFGPMQEYTFQSGEHLTRLSLWGNGAGTRAGWIEFETSLGGRFSHGMYEWSRKAEYPIDIGSGLCVGLFGQAGADIDALGLAFAAVPERAVLREVTFPTLTSTDVALTPQTVLHQHRHNGSSVPQSLIFTATYDRAENHAFRLQGRAGRSAEACRALQIDAPALELGRVGPGVGLRLGQSMTLALQGGTTHSETVTYVLTVPPYSRAEAQLVVYRGTVESLPFQGTLDLYWSQDRHTSLSVSGEYSGQLTSSALDTVQHKPLLASPA